MEEHTDSNPFSQQENSDNSLNSALGVAVMHRRYGVRNAWSEEGRCEQEGGICNVMWPIRQLVYLPDWGGSFLVPPTHLIHHLLFLHTHTHKHTRSHTLFAWGKHHSLLCHLLGPGAWKMAVTGKWLLKTRRGGRIKVEGTEKAGRVELEETLARLGAG